MFDRFKKHDKWRSLVAIEKLEVQLSLVITLLVLGFLHMLDVYDSFTMFKDALQTMIGGFLGGFIALLGFALSAVALVASLFGKKDLPKIKQRESMGIEDMLANFEYLGMVTAVTIIVLSLVFITMEVDWPFSMAPFYVLAGVVIYLILFTMFYTVSLVSNCVKLYMLKLDEAESDDDQS